MTRSQRASQRKTNRLVAVTLDENSIGRSNPDVEHERAVAIYDLLEQNTFRPRGHEGGPYALNLSITGNRLLTLVISTFLALATAAYLRFTLFGLATRAVIQNRDASSIVGINLPRIYVVSLCFGFSLACASGVLISMMDPISPIMGFGYSISAFVVIMLGGLGNLFGGITAAFALGAIETYGLAFAGSNYRSLLVYGIFVLVLVLRPEGLFGKSQANR